MARWRLELTVNSPNFQREVFESHHGTPKGINPSKIMISIRLIFNYRREPWKVDFEILNLGQVTRVMPELATHSPISHIT
ncbi:hypothetical protein TNCV_4777141 [Trichonephila clavipes]|nr:hypothetical protein TNCV_4777141 [Trichonephila clavipes]